MNNFKINKSEYLYLWIVVLFSVVVIVSNFVTVKVGLIPFIPWMAIPCGLLTYPLTFLLGDLVTEIYGIQRARLMIYIGLTMCIVSQGITLLSLKIPPHPDWVTSYNPYSFSDMDSYEFAFQSIFGLSGLALISSMTAYITSQLLDIRIFSFFKELTESKHLWLRNLASTLTSQIVDTLVVNILFLYCGLKLDLHLVVMICLYCYIFKIFFTILNIPLFYLLVWLSKKYLSGKKVFSILEKKNTSEMVKNI